MTDFDTAAARARCEGLGNWKVRGLGNDIQQLIGTDLPAALDRIDELERSLVASERNVQGWRDTCDSWRITHEQSAKRIAELERQRDKALAIPPAPPWLEGSSAHNHALYLMRRALTDTEASNVQS